MPALNFSCVYHKSVLSCKLATSFSTFAIFIIYGINGKFLWNSCYFSRYWASTARKLPSSLPSLGFFMQYSLNWEISLIHSKLFTGIYLLMIYLFKLLRPYPNIYIIYIEILNI